MTWKTLPTVYHPLAVIVTMQLRRIPFVMLGVSPYPLRGTCAQRRAISSRSRALRM